MKKKLKNLVRRMDKWIDQLVSYGMYSIPSEILDYRNSIARIAGVPRRKSIA